MRSSAWMAVAVVGGLASLAGAEPAAAKSAAKVQAGVLWPAGDIKWTDNPNVKGVQQAVLWGDPKTGAYGALKKMPGGTDLGLHSHSHEQKVVVVSGEISFNFDGEAPKVMSAGSYAQIPAGKKHAASCKASAGCEYFELGSGVYDMKPAEAAKK